MQLKLLTFLVVGFHVNCHRISTFKDMVPLSCRIRYELRINNAEKSVLTSSDCRPHQTSKPVANELNQLFYKKTNLVVMQILVVWGSSFQAFESMVIFTHLPLKFGKKTTPQSNNHGGYGHLIILT